MYSVFQEKDHLSTGWDVWAVHTEAETEAQRQCTWLLLKNKGVPNMLVNLQVNIEDIKNIVCTSALCSCKVMYLS